MVEVLPMGSGPYYHYSHMATPSTYGRGNPSPSWGTVNSQVFKDTVPQVSPELTAWWSAYLNSLTPADINSAWDVYEAQQHAARQSATTFAPQITYTPQLTPSHMTDFLPDHHRIEVISALSDGAPSQPKSAVAEWGGWLGSTLADIHSRSTSPAPVTQSQSTNLPPSGLSGSEQVLQDLAQGKNMSSPYLEFLFDDKTGQLTREGQNAFLSRDIAMSSRPDSDVESRPTASVRNRRGNSGVFKDAKGDFQGGKYGYTMSGAL